MSKEKIKVFEHFLESTPREFFDNKNILDVIGRLQGINNEYSKKYFEITLSVTGYDDLDMTFTGARLENDEEYQKRMERHRKYEETKHNRKKSQKERELSTLRTLAKKHNIDLKEI